MNSDVHFILFKTCKTSNFLSIIVWFSISSLYTRQAFEFALEIVFIFIQRFFETLTISEIFFQIFRYWLIIVAIRSIVSSFSWTIISFDSIISRFSELWSFRELIFWLNNLLKTIVKCLFFDEIKKHSFF